MISDALSTYLDDHRAGAAGGEQLAKRLAETNVHQPWGRDLRLLSEQVTEDVRTLDEVRKALGLNGGLAKRMIALAGGYVIRWRPDRVLLHGEALPRVLELEAMMSGVTGKRQLWVLLGSVADDARLDGFDFEGLAERATEQIALLRSVHAQAAERLVGRAEQRATR